MAVTVETVTPESLEVGRKIAAARERQGLTQMNLALAANASVSTIQRWESGKLPPVSRLIQLARLLEIDPRELVEVDLSTAEQLAALRAEVAELKAMVAELLRRSES